MYSIYGLTLSSNQPIPGLPSAKHADTADVQVRLGEMPREDLGSAVPWHQSTSLQDDQPALRIYQISTGALWLRYADETEFLVSAAGDLVNASWPAKFTIGDAIVYLLGPIMGLVLRLRGIPCLHASVVACEGRAAAFLGPGGVGKSTVAATFATAGYRVLSDDLLVVSPSKHGFMAEPGYSQVRLWPGSVAGLYGNPEARPPLVSGWEKRYLDLEAEGVFAAERAPLRALYVLGNRLETCEPRIESMTAREALLSLAANSYTGRMPGAAERRVQFELMSNLVDEVPVRRLFAGGGWQALSSLPETVADDLAQICEAR